MKKRLLATTALTVAMLVASAPKDASADPVTLTVLGTAMASGVGAGLAGATLAAAFQAFVVSAAIGFVSQALMPKPQKPRVTAGGFVQNNIGSALDHAIIYGETKVGGVVFYASTSNNETILHRMIAVAGHEIDSYVSFYLNDEEITIGSDGVCTAPERFEKKVYIETRTGTDNQTAVDLFGFYETITVFNTETDVGEQLEILADVDLDEAADNWTDEHRARGIAYIYCALKFDQEAFPNGVPTLTAVVKGKKVYDPRTSSTAWSDNSALCVRDYLTADYGLDCDSDEIDDTTFADAANDCDDLIAVNRGGTEKRYTMNGTFTTGSNPSDVLTQMMTSYAGMIWYSQGKFGTRAGTWDAPTLTFDENDLIGPIEVTTRLSRRDQVNEVHGIFRGAETNYQQTDYPAVKSAIFLTEDNNQRSVLDLALPFSDTSSRAQRIAKIALYRQREQLRVSVSMGLSGFKAKIGDIIKLTNTRMGWTEKPFEVVDWSFALSTDMSFNVSMKLAEISEAVFDWDAEEQEFILNNTVLPSPFSVATVGLTISNELRKTRQSVVGILLAEITSSTPTRVASVELQFKLSSEDNDAWRTSSTGPLGRLEIVNLIDGETYDFRVRALSPLGLYGAFTTVTNQTFTPFAAPPQDVTDFDHSFSRGNLIISWTPVPDLDASYYEIRHSSATSGATFDSSGVIATSIAHPTSTFVYTARAGTYFIAAVDRSGNKCENHAHFIIFPGDLPTIGVTLTQTEDPTFSGDKTDNMTVVSSELLMDSFSTQNSDGTYLFSNHIDLGGIENARVDMIFAETRHHANATAGEVNWDDISDAFSWDNWPGSFDDWTYENVGWNDYDYEFYVRATDDDPGGASPTWGNWSIVSGGELTGRGFEFKLEVSNIASNVSPAFSEIEAQVSY